MRDFLYDFMSIKHEPDNKKMYIVTVHDADPIHFIPSWDREAMLSKQEAVELIKRSGRQSYITVIPMWYERRAINRMSPIKQYTCEDCDDPQYRTQSIKRIVGRINGKRRNYFLTL